MPTREGTGVALLVAAVFLLATNLMSGLLFALDALLTSLLVVGAASSFLPLRGMRVRRRAPLRGTEGTPLLVDVTLSSAGGGRVLSVEDGWPGVRARAVLPQIVPGVPAPVSLALQPARRGRYALGPVEVLSRGMLGLVAARRRFPVFDRVTIWPQVQPVPPQVLSALAPALEGQTAGDRTHQPEELYGVRDYQSGDSLARIHWRSSARRGALVVREFERTTGPAAAVVVDLDRRQPPPRLDAAVRAAASLFHAAKERQADVALVGWEETLIEHRVWEAAMDWLAGVVPCAPPLAEVLPVLGASRRSLIVVAATASLPPVAPGVIPVLPAEDVAGQQGTYAGLVYSADGAVRPW